MKYKNINVYLEDVSYCVPTPELFKQTYKSLVEFNSYRNDYERTIMFRFYKWRLVISINRLVELAEAGQYELDTEVRPTGTDNITTIKK